ncbi:MAG: PspC domain-containing protein [Actinobacteria bacterium]|nr:PspC domain-containing protein [Actinomycetota bacterium]
MSKVDTDPAQLPPPTTPPEDAWNERRHPLTGGPQQRWARSDDRVVLGVAGGLGRALAIEPIVVRVCFVALALFSGVGVLLYLAGVALLADSITSPPTSPVRRILGGAVGLIALAGLFGGSASLPGAGWVVALGLAGIAMALWRGGGTFDGGVAAATDEATVAAQVAGDAGNTDTSASWTAPPAKPRPARSPLGLLTIGAAAMAAAIAWMANSGADNRGTVTLSMATITLGAGLLIGAFFGRARWLIVPATFVAAAAVAASAIAFAGVGITLSSVDWGVYLSPGDRVEPSYETGRGSFVLSLYDYDSDVTTSIEVGIGRLKVLVPDNARVQVDARVGIGEIAALQSTGDGYRQTVRTDTGTGTQLIKLTLRVGIGKIEVVRASAAGITAPGPPTPPGGVPVRGEPARSFEDGTVVFADGSIQFSDGQIIEANRATLIPIAEQAEDGSVVLANGAIIQADGTVITPGGFVVPRT